MWEVIHGWVEQNELTQLGLQGVFFYKVSREWGGITIGIVGMMDSIIFFVMHNLFYILLSDIIQSFAMIINNIIIV